MIAFPTRPLLKVADILRAHGEAYCARFPKKARGQIGRTSSITGLSRRNISDKLVLYRIDKSDFQKP